MHRWRFQRLFRWLIPTLFFCMAVCAVLVEQKRAGGGLDFPSDDAYRNMAVARTLGAAREYAMQPGAPIPAVRDALWRGVLAAVGGPAGRYPTAAYSLGALLGLVSVLITLRLARLLFPFPPFVIYSSVLLIAAPGLLADALDGTSRALATALTAVATLFHVEGLTERRPPLAIACVLMVGLLMWIRVEFALLWLLFSLHAFLISLAGRRRDGTTAFVILRSMTGWFMLALFLAPLIAWNLHVVHVPWPQAMGAPMTADVWSSASPAQVWGHYAELTRQGIRSAFIELHRTSVLAGPFESVLAWFGAIVIAGISFWRSDERPFSLIPLLFVLLPVFLGLAYPFSGVAPASELYAALAPLFVVSAAFGLFRAPFLVEAVYRRWRQGLPEPRGFTAWWIAMGSLLLLFSLARNATALRGRMEDIVNGKAALNAVAAALSGLPDSERPVVTDRPGRLAYETEFRMLDLSGEGVMDVLACLDGEGRLDPLELGRLFADRRPRAAVIWDEQNDFVFDALGCGSSARRKIAIRGTRPALCVVNPPGVF